MKSSAATERSTRRRRRRVDVVEELDFNDDRIPPRTGDPVRAESLLPRRRARLVGLTGAAVPDDLTADDLALETLYDEDGADSLLRRRRGPVDTVLRRIPQDEVFAPPPEDPPEVEDQDLPRVRDPSPPGE